MSPQLLFVLRIYLHHRRYLRRRPPTSSLKHGLTVPDENKQREKLSSYKFSMSLKGNLVRSVARSFVQHSYYNANFKGEVVVVIHGGFKCR
jgi:hypothetical protein